MDKKLEKETTRENRKQRYRSIETVFITVADAISKPHHEQPYHNISESVAAVGKALTDSKRKDAQNDTQDAQKYHQVCPFANTLNMILWRFLVHFTNFINKIRLYK